VSWELLVALLGSAGVGAVTKTVVERWMGRRTARVEDAARLSGASLELLEPYREELRLVRGEARALREEVLELRGELTALKQSQLEHFTLVHTHMLWDHEVVRELASRGVSVGSPPPLIPQRDLRHAD
jgi:hypothetical protein